MSSVYKETSKYKFLPILACFIRVKLLGNVFCVSMPGQEVVELPESPSLEFVHIYGMIAESRGECCQVAVLDTLLDLNLRVRAKDLGSPMRISGARMARFEKSASRRTCVKS